MNISTKINRLLRLILLLQQDEGESAAGIARKLKVTRRTIHRYFQDLTSLNVPWYYDEVGKRYRIGKDFFLPPLHLTAVESLALVALVEKIAGEEQIPLTKPAASAVEKIRGRLGERVLNELGDEPDRMHICLAAGSDADEKCLNGVYEHVRYAMRWRRKLRCQYESVRGNDDEVFLFQPYRLWFEQRAWYAVGYHEGRGDVRSLKLTRFTRHELTDEPYEIPRDFSIDAFRGNAWRMIRGNRTYDVAIRFEAEVADNVGDTRWHATQSIDYNDDGSIIFRCRVDGLDEIQYWVLSYGPNAQVLAPSELIERIAEMAKATAQRYVSRGTPKRARVSLDRR